MRVPEGSGRRSLRRACVFSAVIAASLAVSGRAAAELQQRPGGMVYDSHNNVTYLANPIFESKKYMSEVVGQSNPSGKMTLAQARDFASGLSYGGYDDWRLPWAGVWVTSPSCPNVGSTCRSNEIGHLFYDEVFSAPYQAIPIYCSSKVRTESGNDRNFQYSVNDRRWENCEGTFLYYSQTGPLVDSAPIFTVANCDPQYEACWFWNEYPAYATSPFANPWVFGYGGTQSTTPSPDNQGFVWLVRDGDVASVVDGDSDGIPDNTDNCPAVANANQTDNDADGSGDVCDGDDDNDGYADTSDNCRLVSNPTQSDSDGDGAGDECDSDRDGDGLDNALDNCPSAANVDQTDTDDDGLGDECDLNDDGDDYPDAADNCPSVPNNGQDDLDADSIGDFCDADLDGDGAANQADNCPIDVNVSQDDADGDGAGDACDFDDDNDGVTDASDNCALVVNADQADTDGDGAGNACDADLDGDGAANAVDNCLNIVNPDQHDQDDDGAGDACDPDIDNDTVANGADACAGTAGGAIVDATGCSITQLAPCSGPAGTITPWRNHGKFVSATAQAVKRFREAGLLTQAQADSVMTSASQASCGFQ